MAITDNTAKWQVKKLTNFTDKEREIATQAQAEEGVDNTKVMTPLRTKNAIDKKLPINIYTAFLQIGLTNNATMEELHNAFNGGGYELYCGLGGSSTFPNFGNGSGSMLITNNAGVTSLLQLNNGTINYNAYSSWGGEKGWKQLAINGALSMPSDTTINIDVSTTSYIAPADGWICVRCGNSTDNSNNISYVQLESGYLKTINYGGYGKLAFLPLAKGRNVSIAKSNCSIEYIRFLYAQSEV